MTLDTHDARCSRGPSHFLGRLYAIAFADFSEPPHPQPARLQLATRELAKLGRIVIRCDKFIKVQAVLMQLDRI